MAEPSLPALLWPWLAVAWLVIFWTLFFTSPLPNAQGNYPGLTRWQVAQQLPDLYGSFFKSLRDPRTPSGPQFLSQRLDIAACAALIVLAALALGRLLLRWMGVLRFLDRPTGLALAGGLGLSALSLMTLALGLLGALWQGLFLALFALLVLGEGALSWRSRKNSQLELDAGESSGPRWMTWTAAAACIPFLICMLLGSMLPETDFDVKEYHLQGPKEYLQDGRIHFLPHNVYTSFPFLTEMLSLAGMVVRGGWERGALVGKAVLMTFAPLTALGVWCVTRRIAGHAAAWLAALAYLSTPWAYRISIIAYTEGAACCYVILPALALLVWRELRERPATAGKFNWSGPLLTGLLAGSAVSTKYPGMVYVAIPLLTGIAIWLGCFKRVRVPELLRMLLLYGAGVLLAFGPWMAKNFAETRNPVYPLLYSVFGGVDWDDELQAKFKKGHSTDSTLFWNLRGEIPAVAIHNDWQSPLLFGVWPLALLVAPRQKIWWLSAYAAAILGAYFFLTHRIDRFWVPVIPVLSCLAGVGLWNIWRGSPGSESAASQGGSLLPRLARFPAFALAAFAVIYNFAFVTTALCGNNGYLADLNVVARQSETPTMALVESLGLPAGSKVLFVGDAEVFDANFPLLYNTVFDFSLLEQMTSNKSGPKQWTLRPVAECRETFRQAGVTHVFVNWREVLRYRTTYGYTDFVSPARMQELVTQGLLREVPLPPEVRRVNFSALEPLQQFQVDHWGPELKHESGRTMMVTMYQLYEVVP